LSLKKYAFLALALCLAGAMLFGCAQSKNPNSSNKSGFTTTNQKVEPQDENRILLAEDTSADVIISGIEQKNNELVTPIMVQIGAESKTYQWETTANPEQYPQLIVTDLNSDGQDEIYLFLNKGYGADTMNMEAHIMNMDFSELATPNPGKDLKTNLTSSVEEQDGKQVYRISFNSAVYTFPFEMDASAMWFEEAVIGKVTNYRIEHQRLVISQSLHVAPSINVGTIDTVYRLDHEHFKLQDSTFVQAELTDPKDSEAKTKQEG